MNKIKYIFVSFLVFTSCLNDNDDNLGNTLDVYILNKSFEMELLLLVLQVMQTPTRF